MMKRVDSGLAQSPDEISYNVLTIALLPEKLQVYADGNQVSGIDCFWVAPRVARIRVAC